MKPILSLVIALLVMVGAMAVYHFSDTQVKKRAALVSLQQFSEAVATKDRAKVSAALSVLLTEDAKVHLEVYFFSIGNERPMMAQDFDKAQFIQFIDTTLYPLTNYSYTPSLVSLDAESGKLVFNSIEWADGANMMGGVAVDMRYSSNTSCEGVAVFENNTAKLQGATCQLQFRQVPKPGQEGKFLNKKDLRELLGQTPQ